MRAHKIDVDNTIHVSTTERIDNVLRFTTTARLDRPVARRLFTGHDRLGRAFVNIPVQLAIQDGKVCLSSFIVFQRQTDDEIRFELGQPFRGLTRQSLFGDDAVYDFAKLHQLLNGETVRFHQRCYDSISLTDVDDQQNWTDATLCADGFVSIHDDDTVFNAVVAQYRDTRKWQYDRSPQQPEDDAAVLSHTSKTWRRVITGGIAITAVVCVTAIIIKQKQAS